MFATARPERFATACTRFQRRRLSRSSGPQYVCDVAVAVGQPQQRRVADEHLDASLRAAMAEWPRRVEDRVAHLAGEPAGAPQRPSVDQDSGADADPAEQVDDVVVAAGTAPAVLGEHGQVGVVADRDRQVGDGLLHQLPRTRRRASRGWGPARRRRSAAPPFPER